MDVLEFGWLKDGRFHQPYPAPRLRKKPGKVLADSPTMLDQSDIPDITNAFENMKRIADRNGIHLIIFMVPRYITTSKTKADTIFTQAISRNGKLNFLDARDLSLGREYFLDYPHPSDKFFEKVLMPWVSQKVNALD